MFLKVRDLKKYYGEGENRICVLKGVSFDIKEGTTTVILGPSGSGKSTILNLVGGLEKSDEGQIVVNDKDIALGNEKDIARYRRDTLGFVFQSYNLIPNLTVKENIELCRKLTDSPVDIDELLKALGLWEQKNKFPRHLSGGQQQRVSIARALLTKPAIILADEPTGNLDSATSMEVVELLKSCAVRFHQTTLIVTHQEEVAQMTDRVIRMSDGKIYTRDCNDC